VGAGGQDLATLVARAQLQQQTADLAGYVAERATVGQQLDGFSKQASELRTTLATQQQTAQRLQRQLDSATQAYDKVSQTAPLIDIADKLVPSMAGVFNAASVPEQPVSRRSAVVTVVAFVLTFFAMVLFVFLRAAVAEDPTTEHPPRGGTSPDAPRATIEPSTPQPSRTAGAQPESRGAGSYPHR
jgi:uncharacterized protein involved in exopolysaccharide biosynthesis